MLKISYLPSNQLPQKGPKWPIAAQKLYFREKTFPTRTKLSDRLKFGKKDNAPCPFHAKSPRNIGNTFEVEEGKELVQQRLSTDAVVV